LSNRGPLLGVMFLLLHVASIDFIALLSYIITQRPQGRAKIIGSDFSVVLFRPNFMLASEGYPMKVHKNQRLLTLPSPPNLPCGATNQGTYHGVWWADAFAVT
jgi:hypothetical protein